LEEKIGKEYLSMTIFAKLLKNDNFLRWEKNFLLQQPTNDVGEFVSGITNESKSGVNNRGGNSRVRF